MNNILSIAFATISSLATASYRIPLPDSVETFDSTWARREATCVESPLRQAVSFVFQVMESDGGIALIVLVAFAAAIAFRKQFRRSGRALSVLTIFLLAFRIFIGLFFGTTFYDIQA